MNKKIIVISLALVAETLNHCGIRNGKCGFRIVPI